MRIEDYIISSDRLIGRGAFGTVYLFGNTCLKVFREHYDGMGGTFERFSKIKTNNFVRIKNIFYGEDCIKGYTMDYCKSSGIRLLDQTGEYLLENVNSIRNDIELLSKNKILLNDLNCTNFIIGDRIYIIDPDLYVTSGSHTLLDLNNRYFINCLKEKVLQELSYDSLDSRINREIIKDTFRDYYTMKTLVRDQSLKTILRR